VTNRLALIFLTGFLLFIDVSFSLGAR
jgi:hypothetical protein